MPITELEQQLTLLARRLAKPVRLHGHSGFTVLDRPAYHALWRIAEDGPLRSTALAKLVGVDLSVVSRQVKALEDLGLVRREPDPLDARASLVSATDTGQRALDVVRTKRTEILDEVLAHWSPEDRKEFVRLLTRFNAELEGAVDRRLADS